MTSHFAGCDPGAALSLALLEHATPRPRLVRAWDVFGARHLWYPRLLEAVAELDYLVDGPTARCWIEDWTEARGEMRSRHLAWKGLGHAQGAFCSAWYQQTGELPGLVPVSDEEPGRHAHPRRGWTTILGVPSGKAKGWGGKPDGWHRLEEAARHVAGPVRELLAQVPTARQVDAAEAVLIACACWKAAQEDQVQARLRAAAARSA